MGGMCETYNASIWQLWWVHRTSTCLLLPLVRHLNLLGIVHKPIVQSIYSRELKQLMGEALKHGHDLKLEMNLSMVGLKWVAGQPVGSPMRPSLTTDDQHHLTIAEMISSTYALYVVDQLNQGDTTFSTLSTQFLPICNATTFKTCYEKISPLKISVPRRDFSWNFFLSKN
jgi:hypothetical protein